MYLYKQEANVNTTIHVSQVYTYQLIDYRCILKLLKDKCKYLYMYHK